MSMRIPLLISGLLVLTVGWCRGQVCGCTDSLATNYNADATLNDGSCLYDTSIIHATEIGQLDAVLDGTSTLFYWNNGYWTYIDHDGRYLYRVNNSDASIMQTLDIKGIRCNDAEEVSQDRYYLYFGDIGNNVCGCRQDLRILRVNKNMLYGLIAVDTIAFSYEDQTDFSELPTNSTDFDCEAFIVTDDSIYLFTKQWVSKQTTIYSLPKTPGTHIAHRRGTYNTQGLVTGATYLPEYRLVVLCGYDYGSFLTSLHPFILLLYDFQGNDFFSGNKRRLDFESMEKAQIEAIATPNALDYFITNEHFSGFFMGVLSINIPAMLQHLDLRDYLLPYLSGFPGFVDTLPPPDTIPLNNAIHSPQSGPDHILIYPNPAKDRLYIDFPQELWGAEYEIFNLNGQRVAEGVLNEKVIPLGKSTMPAGQYVLTIRKNKSLRTMLFVKQE